MGRAGVGGRGGGHCFFRVPNSLEGCDGWGEGQGILYIKASVVQWKNMGPWRPEFGPEGRHFVSGNSLFLYFWGSSEAAMGAQRPVWHVNKPNKTGARSVRARTRGKNPLVL
jgi:hypothetical protein